MTDYEKMSVSELMNKLEIALDFGTSAEILEILSKDKDKEYVSKQAKAKLKERKQNE
jgi:hypothetical protein